MRISLRTVALGLAVLFGGLLGFDAKPAQAQYMSGTYGSNYYAPGGQYGTSYYAPAGPYNYGYANPGYVARVPGYSSGGIRSWAPRMGNRRFGAFRRSWGPSYAPIQPFVGVRSI